MSAIRFENVFQAFGERVVFRDFNMEVQRGETKVVLGEGGSGKTTLLRMVLGLVQPDSGRVFVEDQEITGLSEPELMGIRKKIGIVFQEGALFDSLSVGENVA
jgi:phospholipid/cholesterol/gamma-HCH transport system ATP-binding protein